MRSRRADVPDGAGVERALNARVCGLGGVLDPPPVSRDDAIAKAREQHDDRLARRIGRFDDAPSGAYVWTRDVDGWYWLGRLEGAWAYDESAAAIRADLVHVRPCRWLTSPTADAEVPSGVLATFARGGLNWQQTHAAGTSEASQRLWRAAQESAPPAGGALSV
ncbi:GAF domain-containing protein [Demequina muriae]|uniref:GAF domain-containing protein n=1 Tax=Demequina muriae TaxID=3051664 RepID=A0ABT8GK37_9MICO|nr:GAF domain-containing protein [Demequina sp. EGI L300058]MDN4481787.1 GAF domain-containing protein [Demequina sp. EGI L300058]